MRSVRTPLLAAMLLLFAPAAGANLPGPTFCELNPEQCHALVGATRAHFLGMLQQVVRAFPKVPGYRCNVETKYIDEVGYGRSARRAAPERMVEVLWCFQRGTDPRKRYPDVTLTVQLSMLPAAVAEGEANEKQHDLLVFSGPKGAGFLYGKIREWRDPKGVVHRGFPPSTVFTHPQEEVIANGPYLVSAQVGISAESPDALRAFADGFDRAGIAALMAREEQRRKADPETRPMEGVLP